MGAMRILVVDDEEGIRHLIKDILATKGYEVTLAANGEEALGMCIMGDFDVVLVDYDLTRSGGKMNGVQFADSLADLGKNPRKMVLVTGTPPEEGPGMHITSVLDKPFTVQALLDTIPS